MVKGDAGNYTCRPANLDSASIRLHVVNGERIHYSEISEKKTSELALQSIFSLPSFSKRMGGGGA